MTNCFIKSLKSLNRINRVIYIFIGTIAGCIVATHFPKAIEYLLLISTTMTILLFPISRFAYRLIVCILLLFSTFIFPHGTFHETISVVNNSKMDIKLYITTIETGKLINEVIPPGDCKKIIFYSCDNSYLYLNQFFHLLVIQNNKILDSGIYTGETIPYSYEFASGGMVKKKNRGTGKLNVPGTILGK